jgi:Flp pilus assembly protein TadD
MFDALHAGCIPLILSHDYVWPLTEEFDIIATNNNNHTSASSSSILLNPNDFSIRLQADEFVDAKHDENCRLLQTNATTTTTTTTTATNYTTTQTATTTELKAYI